MNITGFIASLFLYPASIVMGYLLGAIIGVKNFWERVSVGWLLGTSVSTYLFFLLYAYAGWRYTWVYTILLFVGLNAFLLILAVVTKRFSLSRFRTEMRSHFQRWHKLRNNTVILVLIGMIAIPVAFAFAQNIHWPVVDWDALALYDFRAKVFAMSGGMDDGIIRGYFLHYPLYTSLLHTFSYVFGIQASKMWYTMFYVATLLVFYSLLQRHTTQRYALLGTFFLAISPRIFQHAQMAYTNLPHAVFLALGYLYLWEWWRKGDKVDVILGATLIMASTWVRLTEPLWMPSLLMLTLGLLKWRRQVGLIIISAILIVILRMPWTAFVAYHDHLSIANPLQIGQGLQLPNNIWELLVRVPEVNTFFWISIFPLFAGYVYPMVISGLYLLYKERWKDLWEYLWMIFFLLFIFAGIFLFSFQFKGWQLIPDSAARMAMFLIPLSIYLVMKSELWLVPKNPKNK